MAMTPEQQAAYDQQMAELKSYAPEPKSSKKKVLIVILAVLLLSMAVLLLLFSRLVKNETAKSVVQNNQITAQDAGPAITATQTFMGLLDQGNLAAAATWLSASSALPNPLTAEAVDSFFGPKLKWSECLHTQQQNYSASSANANNIITDYIYLDFDCTYEDDWKVVIRFTMSRNVTQRASWLFEHASVMDAGTTDGTI